MKLGHKLVGTCAMGHMETVLVFKAPSPGFF